MMMVIPEMRGRH